MKLILPPDADPQPLRDMTAHYLGHPLVPLAPPTGTHRNDALAAAALALSIPGFLLATWDLAERVGLLKRAQRWLDEIRRLPGADRCQLQTADDRSRALTALGAGDLIEAANAEAPRTPPEQRDWDAFLIHAAPDRAVARRLWEALHSVGVDAFLDRASLAPSDDWPRRLKAALQRTRIYVVLVSGHWDAGWYNHDETARAIELVREHADRHLVPVVLPDYTWRAADAPYGLAGLQPLKLDGLDEGEQGHRLSQLLLTLRGRTR